MGTTKAVAQRVDPSAMNAQKSYLVNGGFENWQRGAGPFSTGDRFSADEWKLGIGAGCALSVSRSTTIKCGAYSAELVATKGTGLVYLRQGIEPYLCLAGSTLTFSMWVNTATASSVYIAIGDYDGVTTDGNASIFHSGSGTWEFLTVTYQLRDSLASYSDCPHAFGAWVEIAFAATNASTYIDSGMLVVGDYPEGANFVPLMPAEDLQRCQRFFESCRSKLEGYATTIASVSSPGRYATRKQDVPVITVTAEPTLTNVGVTRGVTQDINDSGAFTVSAMAVVSGMLSYEVVWEAAVP